MLTVILALTISAILGAEPMPSSEPGGSSAAGTSSAEDVVPDDAIEVAYFSAARGCWGYVVGAEAPEPRRLAFSVLAEDGRHLDRRVPLANVDAEQALWDQCGPEARRFAEVVLATCGTGDRLLELLRDPSLLRYHPPAPPAEAAPQPDPVDRTFFDLAPNIGCARVVTARDGRLRLWISSFERMGDDGAIPTARGRAYLQWLTPDGVVQVHALDERSPLHLDTVVDALEPLSSSAGRYLALGLRSYLTIYPGERPRRYAFVMEVRDGGPRLVKGSFTAGGRPRDLLLLSASGLEGTDRFRRSPLAAHYLQYVESDGTIRLAGLSDPVPPGHPGPHATGRVVARRRGARFVIEGSRWERIRLASAWGE